ncbi:peptidase inhibitor family I36 protein [Streptomyces sp. NPDC003036]|uniref:peptidase inhibitor family I36 protein n=1 Tax=Streptomyces sp. NPDC003036 TaxID=3154442 RepID=UPI0033ADDC34
MRTYATRTYATRTHATVLLASATAVLAACAMGLALPASAGATVTTTAPAAVAPRLGPCDTGQLCLWPKQDFRGARQTYELTGIDVDSCVPLPAGTTATAVANRTGRPVTTYQSAECAETGEFETYPGGGTWVPESPYKVRAFKVWES